MLHYFAVIGNPIAHSLSPWIHQHFAKQTGLQLTYKKIQGNEEHFESQLLAFFDQGGTGLNITLPFKSRVFAMAQVATPRCAQAKTANTLWMQENRLHADNTDGVGLINDLSRQIELSGKHVLLLGAGGAARGIVGPLLEAHVAQLTLVNRNSEKAAALQSDFPSIHCEPLAELNQCYDLIINATSAGLRGEPFTLPTTLLHPQSCCYDLSYNARGLTPFVEWAYQQGCMAMDGLGMLVEQAAESFYIWHGRRPETIPLIAELRLKQKTY